MSPPVPQPTPMQPFNAPQQPQAQAPAPAPVPAPAQPYHPPPPPPGPNAYAPPVQQQAYMPAAAPAAQQPNAAPAIQVNETASQGKADESSWSRLEKTRYGLYFLDFLWGVVMWGVTADEVYVAESSFCFLTKSVFDGDTGPCVAIISLGVIMMLVLFVIIGTHSLKHFHRAYLPYLWEAIAFGVMSLLWFILAIVAIAVTRSDLRETREVASLITAGVFAGISHGASAWVAYTDFLREKVSDSEQVAA